MLETTVGVGFGVGGCEGRGSGNRVGRVRCPCSTIGWGWGVEGG